MSVAKRGDGRYTVKYKDTEGRWRQRSFRNEAEARQFDADCQYDATENTRLTLLEAVLVYLKNTEHVKQTIESYEFIVCGYDRKDGRHREGPAEILANRFVDTLTRRDLETVREQCRVVGMSIATSNLYVGKLKAALNWCVEQDLLQENPWGKYKRLPGARHKSRKGTLEDFSKVYPLLPPWLQWAAETAMALCLRPGISELFSLKWSAFDWKEKSVSVYMSKVESIKVVFPPDSYLARAWPRYQNNMASGQILVCPSGKGGVVSKNMYQAAWAHACQKVGVSMPMYALRHIVASEMLANGADLAAVAAQLGHKDLTTTGAFYTHALASSQRRAASALPDCTNLVRFGAENQN